MELGRVVLGAERSWRVLTHTPKLSSAPAPSCSHTPQGKGSIHTWAVQSSGNPATETLGEFLPILGQFLPALGELFWFK